MQFSTPEKAMPGSHFKTVRHCSIIYIILWNTSCAIWKYRIRLQASTMVVMNGVAMMAGSAPSFLAASGSIPPTSFARMTLKNSETLTTMA